MLHGRLWCIHLTMYWIPFKILLSRCLRPKNIILPNIILKKMKYLFEINYVLILMYHQFHRWICVRILFHSAMSVAVIVIWGKIFSFKMRVEWRGVSPSRDTPFRTVLYNEYLRSLVLSWSNSLLNYFWHNIRYISPRIVCACLDIKTNLM